ncbi:hypothetical protein ESP57_02085 [Agromyces fucosus]|uniref:Uncharacterized protein n=1 Tax=Agromyces fucosus TaxID=41985 RepID=A0A4Q2JRC4_9MICO|nr:MULTISPECIES: hypothetical protein [Agromyces]RXZ50622.1 hypothetical protein ESP57_02085 [Agromyces fucosus]
MITGSPGAAYASDGEPDAHGSLSSTAASPAMLMAGAAARTDGAVEVHQADAHYWVEGFNDSGATLTWTVTSDAAVSYNIVALLSSSSSVALRLTSTKSGQPTRTLDVATHSFGWDRLSMGSITIPEGTSTLELKRTSVGSSAMDIKSLEFLATSQQSTFDAAVADSKRPANQWFSDAGYGLFFQYGAWGYPQSGAKKSMLDQACDFDVPAFVNNVKSTGAAYVVWSYTWWTYQISGGNSAIDTILGGAPNSNTLTGQTCSDGSSADLNRKIGAALTAQGIRFMLYYHNGHDQDANWWDRQDFPSSFRLTGVGDRATFFTNWKNVITAIGNQFGTDLDGWFFDDASYYYPAKFEELQETARVGNPDRLVSWNNWEAAAYTPFSDWLNVDSCGPLGPRAGSPVGSTGVYTSGPFATLRAHCNYLLNGGWGVYQPNTPISLSSGLTTDRVLNDLQTARSDHKTISFVPMMWEGGVWDPETLALLREVGQRYRAATCGTRCFELNNTASSITYTGSWAHSANRNAGDYQNDVQYTTTNGDAATVTFTGTGARVFMPTHSSYGAFTVTVDGVAKPGTFTAYAASGYNPKQKTVDIDGLAYGPHTLTITKTGGSYFQVDSIQYDDCGTSACTRMNNDNASIAYSGSWTTASNRNAGDWNDDVRYTMTNNDTATITFSGAAAYVYMPTNPSYGTFTVKVDGVSQPGTFTASNSGGYRARVLTYSATGLSAGPHTLELKKTGGSYFQIDHVDIRQ